MNARTRRILNITIDTVAYAEFVFLATTGLLMRYTLPPGSGHHTTVWGLDRHEWGTLHFWISITFLATLALHLLLHWNWIVGVLRGRKTEASGLRFGLGLFGLITLLILGITPLVSPVESIFHPGQQRKIQQNEGIPVVAPDGTKKIDAEATEPERSSVSDQSGSEQPVADPEGYTEESTGGHASGHEYSVEEISIRGSMTLKQVSEEYNIPVSHIFKELGLPDNTDVNETLGRLRKIQDFEMTDVRRIVLEYK